MSSLAEELDSSYLLTDVCLQLTHRKFHKDVDQVVARARAAGIQRMVCRATNLETGSEALRLCRLFPETLFCSQGFSPNEANKWTEESAQALKNSLETNSECVAVGETGLDFSRDLVSKETQIQVFEACLNVASSTRSPALLTIRNAHSEALKVLKEFSSKEIPFFVIKDINSSEDYHQLSSLLPNLFFAFSGQLFKDENARALISEHVLPANRILLESDSPWNFPNTRSARLPDTCRRAFTPRSLSFLNRYCTFQRNEPTSLPVLCELVASVSGLSAQELALQSTFNAFKVFSIQ